MIVEVSYRVPVYVLVDTETEDVDQVVVDDEHIGDPQSVMAICGDDVPEDVVETARQKARQLVEDDDILWPAWQFGW